jgi:hypothetical protein
MTLKLYELLYNIGAINSYHIFEGFINKIILRERIGENIQYEKRYTISPKRTNSFTSHRTVDYINKLDSIAKQPDTTVHFNKRILFKKNTKIPSEEIYFETEDTCMECRETIQFKNVNNLIILDCFGFQ